jgi:hypothetical protein
MNTAFRLQIFNKQTKKQKHMKKRSKDAVWKHYYKVGDVLHVFRYGSTSNDKIANADERILQTYHFSKEQFDLANSGEKFTMEAFFALDGKVCFDCPFAVSNGAKVSACYTHKMMQYSGFLSSIRSIGLKLEWENIPEFSDAIANEIISDAANLYVRFGTYGEPSLLPLDLIRSISAVAKNHTGYTHQWMRKPEYSAFLMASVHNPNQAEFAAKQGWKSFVAAKQGIEGLVNCPASEEAGFKSTCSKCGLCSGSEGKGKKSVWILQH